MYFKFLLCLIITVFSVLVFAYLMGMPIETVDTQWIVLYPVWAILIALMPILEK